MTSEFAPCAPVLLRPRNIQWYLNSAINVWSSANSEEFDTWQKYADVENEIIEDAFQEKVANVELDGGYIIDFRVQYVKGDKKRQRPVKRVIIETEQKNVQLREERFALPVILASDTDAPKKTSTASSTNEQVLLDRLKLIGSLSGAYHGLALNKTNKTLADVVEEALVGILSEGAKLGKAKEAEWLAKQLRDVKRFGENVTLRNDCIPHAVGETCVYLYTKECFWYKLLNTVLRNYQTMTIEQIKTLGPFCWILDWYITKKGSGGNFTVYRGLTITDEQRQQFIKKNEDIEFISFTSTSRNRKLAEVFGNTLLVFDLDVISSFHGTHVKCGKDISFLSRFPKEEEYLMYPGRLFRFVQYEYDSDTMKHIIHLKSSNQNP